jgi:hypothetical protein
MSNTQADIQYLKQNTYNPLFIIQDYGTPSIRHGEYQTYSMKVTDGRQISESFTFDKHGFQFLNHTTQISDFENESNIKENYYHEIVALVKATTGAKQVEIIDYTIRVSEQQDGVRGIATHVHNDYTEQSAPGRLKKHLGDIAGTDFLRKRVMQLNIWRPLTEPVRVAPLAIVDGSSVSRLDLVSCQLVYPNRIGAIYEVKHNPDHRWYYFSEMTNDEVILIKGYDSILDGRTRFAPHTAFHHPDTKASDAPRKSIEVRTIINF